ncbi:MAG TPA: hypothetical protein DF614_05445 [Methylococcaceae bacterium]|nr:hypothetical protein [Methylococcaceae bacterium]
MFKIEFRLKCKSVEIFFIEKFMNPTTLSLTLDSSVKKSSQKQKTNFAIDEFDKARMERALSMESIKLPEDLTREKKRKFLLEYSE